MIKFKELNLEGEKEKKKESPVEKTRCLILGSGPAGYTAAIYAARANLSPILYQGLEPGGQLTTTTVIENFPGYPEGVDSFQMMEDLKKQAARFGTDIRDGAATDSDLSESPYKITIDDEKVIETETLIIATGARAKYLGLKSEQKFKGSGVSACALCDGFFYKGKDVAVVGGGDTAAEEAIYLAGLCNKVYMIVRKDHLRASKPLQEGVFKTENIEILFEHTTKEITGNEVVDGAILTNRKGEEVRIDIEGFFVAIGHKPNSQIFSKFLETDNTGYIKTEPGTPRTNIQGVFACGDVIDPVYRQAVTAAATGCMAALDAERYLGTRKF